MAIPSSLYNIISFIGQLLALLSLRQKLSINTHYSLLRHSTNFIFYQKFNNYLSLSIYGDTKVPDDVILYLQRSNWASGLLGWKLGSRFKVKNIDITPSSTISSFSEVDLSKSIVKTIQSDLGNAKHDIPSTHKYIQTFIVKIPAESGDGYFRVSLLSAKGTELVSSPSFRIMSMSTSTASPKGSNIIQLPFEILFGSILLSFKTAAFAILYALFPILKIQRLLPGGWTQWLMRFVYVHLGGQKRTQALREEYEIDRRIRDVSEKKDQIDRKLPWGELGIRRDHDVQLDKELGRGGYIVKGQ